MKLLSVLCGSGKNKDASDDESSKELNEYLQKANAFMDKARSNPDLMASSQRITIKVNALGAAVKLNASDPARTLETLLEDADKIVDWITDKQHLN